MGTPSRGKQVFLMAYRRLVSLVLPQNVHVWPQGGLSIYIAVSVSVTLRMIPSDAMSHSLMS